MASREAKKIRTLYLQSICSFVRNCSNFFRVNTEKNFEKYTNELVSLFNLLTLAKAKCSGAVMSEMQHEHNTCSDTSDSDTRVVSF